MDGHVHPDARRLCERIGKTLLREKHTRLSHFDDSEKMNHPTSPPDPTGLLAHASGWLAAALRYLKARLTLAGIEAKAAGAQYGIAIAMVAGALFIALLGYVFLVLTVVFAIAAAFGGGKAWLAVMGGAAILHLVGAVLLVGLARRRCKTGAFEDTRAEFKKDEQWLTHLTAKH